MQHKEVRRTVGQANRVTAESAELAARARRAAAELRDACASTRHALMESLHVANDASRSLTAIRRTLGADPREQFYVVGTERRLHERAFPAPYGRDQRREAGPLVAGATGQRRALIVDADPKSVSQLCTTLSDAGWATLGGDCEAALHGAASFRADVIVLDVSLPDCAMDVIVSGDPTRLAGGGPPAHRSTGRVGRERRCALCA